MSSLLNTLSALSSPDKAVSGPSVRAAGGGGQAKALQGENDYGVIGPCGPINDPSSPIPRRWGVEDGGDLQVSSQ